MLQRRQCFPNYYVGNFLTNNNYIHLAKIIFSTAYTKIRKIGLMLTHIETIAIYNL